ncbi:hypothetical protein TrispH2_010758 [Trichoplax sp. H2]|nr:hypothetical protein TrispH2_010758 [Trichoplax sp. H2]|eukprot:RDD37381.1 hypothetical protein TrispH2_010758 [Trichoplax sp. H2]
MQTYRCKFCGVRFCINCLCGDFPGKMYAPNLCRRCNQKNHRGQKVSCDDAFSEAAQKVITMQNVIKAAKGRDKSRPYLKPSVKPNSTNNLTSNTSSNTVNGKKGEGKSKKKAKATSRIDTGLSNTKVEKQTTQNGDSISNGDKKPKTVTKSKKTKTIGGSKATESTTTKTAGSSRKTNNKAKNINSQKV